METSDLLTLYQAGDAEGFKVNFINSTPRAKAETIVRLIRGKEVNKNIDGWLSGNYGALINSVGTYGGDFTDPEFEKVLREHGDGTSREEEHRQKMLELYAALCGWKS